MYAKMSAGRVTGAEDETEIDDAWSVGSRFALSREEDEEGMIHTPMDDRVLHMTAALHDRLDSSQFA
jgi:hypothetical protein